MPSNTSLDKLQNDVNEFETEYNSTYTSPDGIMSMYKTAQSFNITTKEWNDLIEYSKNISSILSNLAETIIPDIVDAIEDCDNKYIQKYSNISTSMTLLELYNTISAYTPCAIRIGNICYMCQLSAGGYTISFEFESLTNKDRYAGSCSTAATTTLADIFNQSGPYYKPYALEEDVAALLAYARAQGWIS